MKIITRFAKGWTAISAAILEGVTLGVFHGQTQNYVTLAVGIVGAVLVVLVPNSPAPTPAP